MKQIHNLYEKDDHKWTVVHRDPKKPDGLLDTNEYVISHNGKHLLLDPGGFAIFPAVLSALVQVLDPNDIENIFASHQDPDIASSLTLWQQINPDIKVYVSWLWSTFMPHFGGTDETYISIPDEGMEIEHNGLTLIAFPAHHMHSAGNFHLYDPVAKILFTGDTGAAFLPVDNRYLFVDDFEDHIQYIEGFHRRWFGSNGHKQSWCDRVQELEINALCPQHGAIYTGENIGLFIDWLSKLSVGTTRNRGK